MTAMEAQDLLFEFGKWARMRPDGWYRCALAQPSRLFWRMTDDSQVFDLNARKLMKRDYTNIQSAGHAELEIFSYFSEENE